MHRSKCWAASGDAVGSREFTLRATVEGRRLRAPDKDFLPVCWNFGPFILKELEELSQVCGSYTF